MNAVLFRHMLIVCLQDFPAVGVRVQEGRNFLYDKVRKGFSYAWDHHKDDADWFLKADDDTYVIVENLR